MKRIVILVLSLTFLYSTNLKADERAALASAVKSEPVTNESGTILFADPRMIVHPKHVRTKLHPPVKTGERLLESDRPWEDATLNWFSVLQDQGKFRMWYECYDMDGWPTADDTSFCYAESQDGIHWTKPNLGLFEYKGNKNNNILFRQIGTGGSRSRVHGSCVFIDPNAPPEARYKCVSQGLFQGIGDRPYYVAGMYSADGLHWTRLSQPICSVFADSQYSAAWNPKQGNYVLYGRVSGRGRALGRAVSDKFGSFPPLSMCLDTDEQHPNDTDLYNPAWMRYPGEPELQLMLPSLFDHRSDTLAIHIALSRDGQNWEWPDRMTPFIPLGEPGAFDSGSLYSANGCLEVGGEVWFYFGASSLKHEETNPETLAIPSNRRVYSRAVAKRNRLVSASAGSIPGSFETSTLQFQGKSLAITADIAEGGYVRIGLQDAAGQPIAGRSLSECEPMRSGESPMTVNWHQQSDVSDLAGKAIRLQIEMMNADLFSLHFDTASP